MALLPALFLAVVGLPLPAASETPKVLVVSGANNHDWEWTTPSLASILRESGRFEVSVTRRPGEALADQDALEALDAVVLDYNGPRWGEAAESAFL